MTLMTGTTIAQAIPIAISPILTRIYTPEDFGVFALYIAIASIVSVIATGRYEMAIMLPKKDSDAINIVALSMLISFFISFITLVIVFIFNSQITNLLNNHDISNWLYFIPVTILLTGIYQSFNYWSNRKKQYKRLATSRVVQSGSTASANLGMGFGGLGSSGLIIGQVLGQSISTTILGKLIWNEDKNKLKEIKNLKIFAMARRYIKFPKYDIPSNLFSVLSLQISNILFNILFTSTIAGFYFFINKILNVPIILLSRTLGDVFKQKAAEDYIKFKSFKNIYLITLKKLILISFLPAFILFIYAVEIVTFIFGSNWKVSGEIAQILIPMFFLKFSISPLTYTFYIVEKQHLNLIGQMILLLFTLLSFYLGYINNYFFLTVYCISISYSIFYFINLLVTYKLVEKKLPKVN
ncbi:lipopolysaccharide biosynthesis protein [Arcobacter acticola]|uniref:lipopolysaccharide biosynthesis protein n=1 Tax=Arcobacter acticola TaxID=1849015 RepID=UPI001E324D1C|nr:oligosaccharide flippase family protein [Arcobacter acticola]